MNDGTHDMAIHSQDRIVAPRQPSRQTPLSMAGLLKPLRRGVWRYLSDRDILIAAFVTVVVFVGTLGLVYVAHVINVWGLARRSPIAGGHRRALLIFGRRLVDDLPEADFTERLARGRENVLAGAADRVLLLGGTSGGSVSEAEAGRRWLVAAGWPVDVPMTLEQLSIDSLENLRHARELLRPSGEGGLPAVWLVTSRYHLARCLYLARRLGFDASPIAAEPRLALSGRYVVRMLMEAGYLMWIDIGMRWAALTGNRRMAARIS
ncbi:YdcF family protein [Luteibacter sp. 22Crub2.1]|uniref:YdcF family protein n=1 Tax=Luteibacter sp. 22Crub2.1 TaxID=1283288 RepID=UPI0009C7F5AB|nr:YdcF family protein [Luteibacter sp. 22Crub2.1]SKB85855.1 protein SanA, affects membrane permeability for vancomycin [Luteibacter sp. 22Crub2.1]